MMFRTILVPTDFSPCSARAASYAADLARSCGATLVLHHASDVPAGLHGDESIQPHAHGPRVRLDAYAREGAEARLQREAERLRGSDAAPAISTHFDFGPVQAAIARAAEASAADLIVMGTHGRSGWRRGLMGSVTEDVLRASKVPVLVLRSDADPDADAATAEEHQLAAERDG
jgi:nucleotide-binding universal stress UspA family protein